MIQLRIHEGRDREPQPAIEILDREDPVFFGSTGEAFEWTLDEKARQRRLMSELVEQEREARRRYNEARLRLTELQDLENDLEIHL